MAEYYSIDHINQFVYVFIPWWTVECALKYNGQIKMPLTGWHMFYGNNQLCFSGLGHFLFLFWKPVILPSLPPSQTFSLLELRSSQPPELKIEETLLARATLLVLCDKPQARGRNLGTGNKQPSLQAPIHCELQRQGVSKEHSAWIKFVPFPILKRLETQTHLN